MVTSDLLEDLDPADRISPIVAAFEALLQQVNFAQSSEPFVETANTTEAKELSTFCRKFTEPLRQALKNKVGFLQKRVKSAVNSHCFFCKTELLLCGIFLCDNHSPILCGILV